MPASKSRRFKKLRRQGLGTGPATALSVTISAALGLFVSVAGSMKAQAGDILRGSLSGGGIPAPHSGGGANSKANAAANGLARQNAQAALSRSNDAVQAVKSMQDAARQVAAHRANLDPIQPGRQLPHVPNGLALGGLQVAPGVPVNLAKPVAGENAALWQGANLPVQTQAKGRTVVTIEQTKQQALLNWQTFNVGKETSLRFDQSLGKGRQSEWIAFNKVNDPSGVPSQILGSIEAPGQVYVINRNGIIFGGNSQVNTHGFLASTLPISDALVARGLLNQESKNVQFLFSGVVNDPQFKLGIGQTAYTFAQDADLASEPVISYLAEGALTRLTPGVGSDYVLSKDAAGKQVVTFTPAGLAKAGSANINVSYTVPSGSVVVQPGARLSSPTNSSHTGGRIALVGANVSNAGTISTPDGQTILAAGRQVGFAGHASSDPTLRGLDVFVGAVDSHSGVATNSGLIDAPRAAVTMTGKTVNQLGAIDSSTSVSLNGRIDLQANYGAVTNAIYDAVLGNSAPFLLGSTGLVTLGSSSITRILPEISSTETAIGTELALRSQVNIQGKAIHLAGNAAILAPNAKIGLNAGIWAPLLPASPISTFVYATGQIYLDNGASINAAGTTDVSVPISQNFLDLQLRGAELADSPLQRGGLLRGATITLDLRNKGFFNGFSWVGTPLGDASGFAGLIQRSAAQLTTAGGSVRLKAGGSVVLQSGSVVDVSGGTIDFTGGIVNTTRVISGAQILDISKATPDQVYDGIYTGTLTTVNAKYGVRETFTHPLALTGAHFEQGYVQGGDGGKIEITAPAVVLDGQLLGRTVDGPRQFATLPLLSELSLVFQREKVNVSFPFSPTPPKIVFQQDSPLASAGPFSADAAAETRDLRSDRQKKVFLSPELLTSSGFGKLTIDNSDGDIFVPSGVTLSAPALGSISLSAANLDVQGNVQAPGGALNFFVFTISPSVGKALGAGDLTPIANSARGNFTLGSAAQLSTAGMVIDQRANAFDLPLVLDGGSISIRTFSAKLFAGSTVDVSGGVVVSATGKRTYGAGGSITIEAGRDPSDNALAQAVLGGHLDLNAALLGFSGGKGGSLTLQAPQIQIGGTAPSAETFLIDPAFFNTGGFTSFTLSGLGSKSGAPIPAILIAPGTVIAPVVQSSLAVTGAAGEGIILSPILKPEGLRTPVSLTFNALGVEVVKPSGNTLVRGDFVMAEGASIQTDPKGSVTINGQTIALLGSVSALGGSITLTGASKFPTLELNPAEALATVYLGPSSVLSAAGAIVLTPDPFGRRTGSVIAGGSISVSGNIAAQAGAILDVSGATGMLDLPVPMITGGNAVQGQMDGSPVIAAGTGLTGPLFAPAFVSTRVDSDAGSITLKGAQELFSNATLLGKSGGRSALGGTLSVSSGRFYAPNDVKTPADIDLAVTQGGFAFSESAIGKPVRAPNGTPLAAGGHFSVNTFDAGGFDSLTLGGNVQFFGPVTITARRELSVASSGVLKADSAVHLTAPHVTLGTPFQLPVPIEQQLAPFLLDNQPFAIPPTFGRGTLTVTASLIDIGNLSLQNIGSASFIADGGDIRGNGTLDVAGDIYLRAGQIYPPSAVRFTIAAYDKTVTVAASSVDSSSVTLTSSALPPGFGVGSPLLDSTVQSIDGNIVTLAANANAAISSNTVQIFGPGSVTIASSGARQLPLSAGGELDIYGSIIHQGGVLRAPLGTINIGWDGTGTAPKDLVSQRNVAVAQQISLTPGSITSVSAIDPISGQPALIPYGLSTNGTSFFDPAGVDISAGGAPGKGITIAGQNVAVQKGSTIDIRGGGDLYAYRYLKGNGGSSDILGWNFKGAWKAGLYKESEIVKYQGTFYYARTDLPAEASAMPPAPGAYWKQVSESFAVIPGYESNFAPYAPFNNALDPGYTHAGLAAGDRVQLGEIGSLSAGTYTLLPARYALLPGAVLVTPQASTPIGTFDMPDGGTVVSGYRFNDLNNERRLSPIFTRFEVASGEVVRQRGEYQEFFANTFLRDRAETLGLAVPRLPTDAGHLILQAAQTMALQGNVLAKGADAFSRSGLVDISSASAIVIGGPGTTGAGNVLVLDASQLSSFGAESLLIGGVRKIGASGTTVTVNTSKLTVDNAGSPLRAPEIILVAKENLTVEPGSVIEQEGNILGASDTLLIGNAEQPGSGDGLLLRVTSDTFANTIRAGVSGSTLPHMIVGAGARIAGTKLLLDSTFGTSLDPAAVLDAEFIGLNSGQISMQLDNPGALQPTEGLVLAGGVLRDLSKAQRLSLLSYSTLDLYGTGKFSTGGKLALHAAQIRGFNNGGGTAGIGGGAITLDNRANGNAAQASAAVSSALEFNAKKIRVGVNQLHVDQFENVTLNASRRIQVRDSGGLTAQAGLTAATPSITAARAATQSINAGGALIIQAQEGRVRTLSSGLGASLTLEGGTSLAVASNIRLPSGLLTLHAKSGDITVGSRLDAGGASQKFFDLVRYTDAGQINLMADSGSVTIAQNAAISVAAAAAGGKAGALAISTPGGNFTLDGKVFGQGGAAFSLDTASLPAFATLSAALGDGGFTEAQTIRVRTGDVLINSNVAAHVFHLSADQGVISVSKKIDASGLTGGRITLAANGNITLLPGSELTAAAEVFSSAGKGGAVSLETRTGFIDLQSNSAIDLSVAAVDSITDPALRAAAIADAQTAGKFTGTLHLRAPQTAGNLDLQVNALAGNIAGSSSINVEGFRIYTPGGGLISKAVQDSILANGTLFGGNSEAITSRLLAGNLNNLEPVVSIQTGAEITSAGNLTLGTSNSASTADWNLAAFRFGPKQAPGVLTLRAAGNVVFFNSLSDGFVSSTFNSALLASTSLLPANAQSWSYRITAGADLSAADAQQIMPASTLADGIGSLKLGKNSAPVGSTIATAVPRLFQVIRTGSGDIDISAARNVEMLNLFSNIYTAGTQVADPTMGGTFELPKTLLGGATGYPAQYSLAGGNVTIAAAGDIRRDARLPGNTPGSQEQLPMNWLYRRGAIDPATGLFEASPSGGNASSFGEIASTSWWVDFSNFFEGVGALGGGNVSLIAGADIVNVDGLIPTNARMAGRDTAGNVIAPSAGNLLELGGGDLIVHAGRDIDAGVYYVERGKGTLIAGHEIKTNETRFASKLSADISSKENWLPTTLFAGKSSFDVSARGDVLIGPALNPFLLPQAVNNGFSYKTTFSTFAPDSAVAATSLGGSVTLRQATSLPADGSVPNAAVPVVQAWLDLQIQQSTGSNAQPWLRLAENAGAEPFMTAASLLPGTLRLTAFSGYVNLAGSFNLSPSPAGTIELLAGGAISGLQPTGASAIDGVPFTVWSSSTINLSDASPSAIPGIASAAAFQNYLVLHPELSKSSDTTTDFLGFIDQLFAESGSTQGQFASVQTKQSLHGTALLHAADLEPVRFYAKSGDVSDFTFFGGKAGRFLAGRDITDIGLYLQNVRDDDVSVVSAGRDIVAFNDNSPLRAAAISEGNFLAGTTINPSVIPPSESGDIQISGPGTLEVLAGRNLDLGTGANRIDGTGVGLTSIGNVRNLNLPIEGANLIAGAGIAGPASLGAGSSVDVEAFINKVLTSENIERYLPEIASAKDLTAANLEQLSPERQAALALDIFYLVLRDAGRDHGDPAKPGFGTYNAGFGAISAIFGNADGNGDISTQARDIRTKSGGSISLIAPSGKLSLASTVIGNPLVPPGVVTEAGGAISVFTGSDVNLGISRIFTLRGGDIVIWSSKGDIAAGTSAKTVKSAPPTRVLIDPQSADVQTDLAGLATGGGIGVLATVGDVEAGDVDLIAPLGTVDAGDAGIRASGNLSIAAVSVLNANNIQVSGSSAGVPSAPAVAAPNLGGLTAASTAASAGANTADEAAKKAREQASAPEEQPSVITVEVIGYGGAESASL